MRRWDPSGSEAQSEIPIAPRAIWKSFHESTDASVLPSRTDVPAKTVAFVNDLFVRRSPARFPIRAFAYVAPYHAQAKAIAWDYMRFFAREYQVSNSTRRQLRVDFPNKARVRVFGAENPDALARQLLRGVVLDEFGT